MVYSKVDPAGSNMAKVLRESFGFEETEELYDGVPIYKKGDWMLVGVEPDIIYADGLDDRFDPDYYIFLSRHEGKGGIPTLSAHFTGNFSKAEFGGRDRELSYSYPSLHRLYLLELTGLKDKVKGYEIVTEPTHHGPTSLKKPLMFVEIGPSRENWLDLKAIEVMMEALIEAIRNVKRRGDTGIAFGGPHYSKRFTEFLLREFPLGHIAPKYALPHVDEELLGQMIGKCVEGVRYAVVERKLGREKARILKLVEESGLELVRI